MTLKEKHINLIKSTGGIVIEDNYVVKPGIMITQESKPTVEAQLLFDSLNLNSSFFPHAELNSRITYLSFPDSKNSSSDYLDSIKEHGHLSIFNDTFISVLVAGVSIEAELEFVAHNEAKISRLTSSRTAAQSDPLFTISDLEEIYFLTQFKNLSKPSINLPHKDLLEFHNKLNPSSKAVSFIISMSLKDWHKTFIGRFSDYGVEKEVRTICSFILYELRKNYSFVLFTEEEYYHMNNSKKY